MSQSWQGLFSKERLRHGQVAKQGEGAEGMSMPRSDHALWYWVIQEKAFQLLCVDHFPRRKSVSNLTYDFTCQSYWRPDTVMCNARWV